jgi:putative transposase
VPTWQGFVYLAVVLDVFSRRIVGWAMAEHMRTELVTDALAMALHQRRPEAGVIHHSDEGGQGGFNWSSQHLSPRGGCCGARKGACGDSGWSSAASVTGPAPGQPARGAAAVLAADR